MSAAALLAARQQAAGAAGRDRRPHRGHRSSRWTPSRRATTTRSGPTPAPASATSPAGRPRWRSTAATYYAGTADGGVWKSTDAGRDWQSIWDDQTTLSIGALLVRADHSLWVGTGEANTNSDSYVGVGVYRSTERGRTLQPGRRHRAAESTRSSGLRDDGYGHVYAATNQGLYRHSAAASSGGWTLVLKPDPNPTGSPYVTSFITDVAVKPGTHGQTVLAVLGWRNGTPYNGFYLSTTGGGAGSFSKITPTGDIDADDIGRTTLAYAADGSRLYAIVQSPEAARRRRPPSCRACSSRRTATRPARTRRSPTPTRSATPAPRCTNVPGYHVGIQAWYNQALAVDPTNPMARLRQPRRGLRDPERRHDLHHRQPVLELRPGLRRILPADHAPRPARAGFTAEPAGRDRQRRRRVQPADVGDRLRPAGPT